MNPEFQDPLGAFVAHGKLSRSPQKGGPLSGMTVAVKDLFDWEGVPTGAGNPTWLATHPVPERDAGALAALSAAGATLWGKTVTDELAYSLQGDNVHYGTPTNPGALGRVPGGSSSGSAAAVAGALVDAALGTDTGGSVRVPAAYCGLFGIRTTHGRVERSGLVALAPSFDTVGWFGRTPGPVAALGEVLLPTLSPVRSWGRIWTLPEAEALTDPETRAQLGRVIDHLELPTSTLEGIADALGGLEGLRRLYTTVQGWEAWATHGAWITAQRPSFGPAIEGRFRIASQITQQEVDSARASMDLWRNTLRAALGPDGVLVLPATAGPAPLVGEESQAVDQVRIRTMRLTCLAGLAGLPQITVPGVAADGLPRGVGLLGPEASDRALISLAAQAAGGN